MAMLNGVEYKGGGWSPPDVPWANSVTRGHRRWGTPTEGDGDDTTGDAGGDGDGVGGGRDDGEGES